MCNCFKRYEGEEGKKKIIELAKKSKELTGEKQGIARNSKKQYYFDNLSSLIDQGIEILEII